MAVRGSVSSYTREVTKYIRDVLDERVPACRWVKLACAREERDQKEFKSADSPYYYDPVAATRICITAEQFPHVKGIWARTRSLIVLQPWQMFILATFFGWKRREDKMRRFRTTYV